ncbi:hypothetical protein VTK26DRAFT_5315 [Humicola hyalothermophila]
MTALFKLIVLTNPLNPASITQRNKKKKNGKGRNHTFHKPTQRPRQTNPHPFPVLPLPSVPRSNRPRTGPAHLPVPPLPQPPPRNNNTPPPNSSLSAAQGPYQQQQQRRRRRQRLRPVHPQRRPHHLLPPYPPAAAWASSTATAARSCTRCIAGRGRVRRGSPARRETGDGEKATPRIETFEVSVGRRMVLGRRGGLSKSRIDGKAG